MLSLDRGFFRHNGGVYLSFVVSYRQAGPEGTMWVGAKTEKKPRWREVLGPELYPLFNTLRDWRAERAKREGVPPYVICTNTQLAQIVRLRPGSLSKLGEIEGIGKAKLEKYGKELVALVSPGPTPGAASPEETLLDSGESAESRDGAAENPPGGEDQEH